MIIILVVIIMAASIMTLIYFAQRMMKSDKILDSISQYLSNKQYEEAVETGLKYLKKNNYSYPLFQKIAQAYEGLYQFRHAIEYYEKSLVFLSEEINNYLRHDVYNKLGELYTTIRDPTSALGYYNLVLKENGHNMKALFFSARLLYEQKQLLKSRDRLEIYLRVRPREIAPLLLLANVLYEMKEYKKSIEILDILSVIEDEIVSLRVNDILLLLAKNFIALKSYAKAISSIKKLLDKGAMLAEAVPLYVIALLGSEKIEQAMLFFNDNQSLLIPDKKLELMYLIAQARFDEGDIYPAIDTWKEISVENPAYLDIKDILEKVNVLFENPILQNYFTIDEERFQEFIIKKFLTSKNNIIQRGKEFWIIQSGKSTVILYRKAHQITQEILNDMGDSIIANALFGSKSNIYALYGIDESCKYDKFYKSIKEISGDQFLNFFNLSD